MADAKPPQRDPLIEMGWSLIRKNQPDRARRLFKEAAAVDPQNLRAHLAYQTVMFNLLRVSEMQDEYRSYASSRSGDGMASYLYYTSLTDENQAEAELRKALKSNPGDRWLRFAGKLIDASDAIDEGREESALEALGEEPPPGMANAWHRARAFAFEELGRYDDAARELKEAIQEVPFDPANYRELSHIYYFSARFEESLKASDESLRLAESASARSWRKSALEKLGRLKESQAEISKILSSTPVFQGDYSAIGWAFAGHGELKKAWDYLDESRKRSSCLCTKAEIIPVEHALSGYEKARQDCDALLKINPHKIFFLSVSGNLHLSRPWEAGQAVADFDAVLKSNPRDIEAWIRKAQAHMNLGRPEESLKAAQEAVRLAPRDSEALILLAKAQFHLALYDKTALTMERLLAVDPDRVDARIFMGQCRILMGRPREAEKIFEEARQRPGSADKATVESWIANRRGVARDIMFKRYAMTEASVPGALELAKAPAVIQEFIGVCKSTETSTDECSSTASAVSALGPVAAPWLKRIVLSKSEDISPSARSMAADTLADLGRWDDLLDCLLSPQRDAAYAAQLAFVVRIVSGLRDRVEAYLPRVEGIARTSIHPGSRLAAMGILSATRDRRYAGACAANLTFSAWAAKADQERRRPLAPESAEALSRFLAVCPTDADSEVRVDALRCMARMEDPATITSFTGAGSVWSVATKASTSRLEAPAAWSSSFPLLSQVRWG